MRMIKRSLEALAVVAVLALQAVPSQAQPFEKTFVRSDGSDGLDCQGLSTRCVSIARGVLNVNAGGTVNVLDPNTQAAFTIDKSLSILAVGGENTVVRSSAGVAGPSIQPTSTR